MLEGSFVTRKFGPLPAWAWMGLGLGAALAFASWRGNKAASNGAQTGDAVAQQYKLPESIQPSYAFVEGNTTIINQPPGGGRGRTPRNPPPGGPGVTPPPTTDPPATQPPSTNPPPAPQGKFVQVVPWKSGQSKGTPSTLWGIAEKVYGAGNSWAQIWNAPQNAALKAKRGAPEKIQPGDTFWVPTA